MSAQTVDAASALAHLCGERVEVLDERTPWETSYVTEAGKSVLEISVYPTRTDVNGEWEPVDTTIEESSRAGVPMEVAAPVLDMQLNGGDAAVAKPLGVIESGGHTFKVWFPLTLPEPSVDDNRATYELSRGVRVVTYVSPAGTGFTPVIELDDPAAASWFRSALQVARAQKGLPGTGFEIPLRYELSPGLATEAMPDGTVHITDSDGAIVFQAPPAYMWDSSGALPTDPPLPGDPHLEPEGDRAEWAWPGDVVAQMPVRIDGSSMVLTPDSDILSSDETEWPVHIDPGFSGHRAADWTMLRTGGYTSSMYRFTNLSSSYPGGGVGRCVGAASCGVSYYIARLVWQFAGLDGIGALAASDVDSATFSMGGISSYNCNAATTELWHTGGINSSSTWGNVPFYSYQTANTSANKDGCAQGQGWRDFDITGALRYVADTNTNQITFGLKAADEGSMAGWKRIRNDAKLAVTYNRPPSPPTNVRLTNPVASCASGAGRPVINSSTPTIAGTLSDPDGGIVYPSFQVYNVSSGAQVWASGPAGVASGSGVSATVSPGLADGVAYGYRITSHDGAKWSGWNTSTCEFIVDTVAPVSPTVAPVTSGVAAVYASGQERGGVGVAGSFTLNRSTSTDVSLLRYRFSTAPTASTVAPDGSGTAVVAYTPTVAGPVTLTVDSRDAAGNWSAATTYSFDVAAPKANSVWKLDEGAGSTGTDSGTSTPLKPMSITGATWATGPETLFGARTDDKALQFNGSSAFASSAPAVTSTGAFSVSARVWLSQSAIGGGNAYTAVSQDGVNRSEFALGYEPSCSGGLGCWSFRMPNTDTAASGVVAARSTNTVAGDRWVQLVGIYDPAAAGGAKVRLWVCDVGTPDDPGDGIPVSVETARPATPWTSGGAFTLGRGRTSAAPAEWWPGLIDQVEVFNGAVITNTDVSRSCSAAAGVSGAGQ